MKWFGGRKSKDEIWELMQETPIGEFEAARAVRDICRLAQSSAQELVESAQSADHKRMQYETGRYESAKKHALKMR